MIKRILAAMVAFIILLSLFACAAEKPEETTPEQTTGTEPQNTTGTQGSQEPIKWLSYEEYLALTPEQQQAYYKLFSSPEEYMVWFNAVAKNHNDGSNSTQIEGNEGHVTQPTEPETAPVPETTTPLQTEEQTTQKPTTPIAPETTAPMPTEPEKEMPVLLTYEEYMALSPAVQQAYYESFPSVEAYMDWFNEVAAQHAQTETDSEKQEELKDTEPIPEEITQPTETTEENMHLEGSGEAQYGRPENP